MPSPPFLRGITAAYRPLPILTLSSALRGSEIYCIFGPITNLRFFHNSRNAGSKFIFAHVYSYRFWLNSCQIFAIETLSWILKTYQWNSFKHCKIYFEISSCFNSKIKFQLHYKSNCEVVRILFIFILKNEFELYWRSLWNKPQIPTNFFLQINKWTILRKNYYPQIFCFFFLNAPSKLQLATII